MPCEEKDFPVGKPAFLQITILIRKNNFVDFDRSAIFRKIRNNLSLSNSQVLEKNDA